LGYWNVRVLTIAVALGFALCSTSALAQSGTGSIQGTVTDATGAVIPGASIHVVQQGTNATFDTKSNGVGFYQVPGLFTGTYDVTITAPGMKTYKSTVELQVAQAANINPSMSAGSVTQQVQVAADVIQLTTTDNGTIASTLENNRINQLPLNGRLLVTLAGETTPGLEATGGRANGLMPEALEYVADGVPLTNRNFGGELNSWQAQLPDPDAVQEVRVETTNTSAQYSEPGTAIITTKSGTDGLHGTFFETARNNAVGIAKARQNPSNYSAPHLVRNEFGASAGGPIILPKVYNGKDRSFWFFAFERYSLSQIVDELVTVPTTAMRSGDFSGLINSSGVLQQLYDPATTHNSGSATCPGTPTSTSNPNGVNTFCRSAFPNNNMQGRLAPASKIIYDITAPPTTADNPLVTSNRNEPDNTYVVIPTVTFRLDHSFNESNKVYLRYTDNYQTNSALRNLPVNEAATIAADGFPAGANGFQVIPIENFGAGIGYTHVFSPTFFAETLISQQWFNQYVGGVNANIDYESKLGLPNNFGEPGFPFIGEASSALLEPFSGSQYQYQENQIISNIDENLTKTVGRHQMEFGGRYRHERFRYLPDRSADTVAFGAYATALENPTSGANYSATANTGYPDADFYLGAASSYSVNLQAPNGNYHDMEFDGYFQDNYHVTRTCFINGFGLKLNTYA
jgi:hypothetical protein